LEIEKKLPSITIECDCNKHIEDANSECFQCGIPITGKPLKFDVDGEQKDFCCFGCYLVYKATGLRGEEGTALAFLGKFGFGYFLSMIVMMLSLYIYGSHLANDREAEIFTGFIKYVILVLSTPVMLLLGIPILKNSFSKENIINFNTDTLIAIGSFSAYFLSVYSVLTGKNAIYFETATMILVLVTFGRYLETSSRAKASNFMKKLLDLSAKKAVVIRDGKEIEIDINDIKIGDIVKILPGEKIPADGIIIEGEGHVDESILTGESKPIVKKVGDRLYSGTISIDGNFKIKVDKPASDWLLNRFIELMKHIRNTKAPINRITDKIAAYFLPFVIILGFLTFVYWYIQEGFEKALIVSMSVLLISCPCAFSIGAPLALWIGLGEAMKEGIIIKGADILEKISSVKTIFFDKTGTITERKLKLSKYLFDNPQMIDYIVAVEEKSEHPIAKAILENFEKKIDIKIEKVKPIFGEGIYAKAENKEIYIGSKNFILKFIQKLDDKFLKIEEEAKQNGEIVVFVLIKDKQEQFGILTFGQKIRDEAYIALNALKKLKLQIKVITGDSYYFANILKKELPVDEVIAEAMPEDKLKAIEEEKKKNKVVAMVGDGINDAPALAKADVGIAMGCGTDLTRESANVSLISDDLRKIPLLILLSRKVKRTIYTNIFWAFIYNIIGMGLAVSGHLTPIFSALAMVLSSAFVIANSIRVKNW